jgi:predicted SAM-dependent methyltransferase
MPLPNGTKAVNIACGTAVAPGWINIDNSPNARLARYPPLRWVLWKMGILSDRHYSVQWPLVVIHDARKRLPFVDCSIDYVYTSHYLEHNSVRDAHHLIAEVFRILKAGGVLRVVVPDLELGARRYLETLKNSPSDQRAAIDFLEWLQLGRPGVRDPHLWMYDAASLSALLREHGFVNVRNRGFREGKVPDCERLDNRPDDSLFIEAEKAGSDDQ